ncbi:MAG: hypothetical protein M3O34_20715, partial [Chloroflexota bacterium]|nr:hypothetical protein [Chloroflexota bacterium]
TGGEYAFERVNVGTQRADPDSLLNWMAALIRVRRECGEIGVGRHRQASSRSGRPSGAWAPSRPSAGCWSTARSARAVPDSRPRMPTRRARRPRARWPGGARPSPARRRADPAAGRADLESATRPSGRGRPCRGPSGPTRAGGRRGVAGG